jgi:cytidylate kinase
MDESRMVSENIPREPASYARTLQDRLDSEARRYKALYDVNPYDVSNYDLVVDTGANNVEQVVALVVKAYQDWLKS